MRDAAAVGCGSRLDRQDLRLQLDKGREVCTAGLSVVRAGAVNVQGCGFLGVAVFEQEVLGVPIGLAAQVTPVEIPVSVALDEDRVPASRCAHADARAAVGVAAAEDCASVRISEDAAVAVGGAVVRGPVE